MGLSIFLDLRTFQSDLKDRVTPRRVLVHVCGSYMSIEVALIEHIHQILGSLDDEGG